MLTKMSEISYLPDFKSIFVWYRRVTGIWSKSGQAPSCRRKRKRRKNNLNWGKSNCTSCLSIFLSFTQSQNISVDHSLFLSTSLPQSSLLSLVLSLSLYLSLSMSFFCLFVFSVTLILLLSLTLIHTIRQFLHHSSSLLNLSTHILSLFSIW